MSKELFSPHTTVIAVDGCAVPPTISDLGKWVPRAEPVIAKDGALFWVVEQHGLVVLARWNIYPSGGVFQSSGHDDDEGMGRFAVSFYQPITKPEAPTC
jgi:hypothetical protein